MNWFKKMVLQSATEAIESGAFDAYIEKVITDFTRTSPDDGLTEIGFLMKMSVYIMDEGKMEFQRAKVLARSAYQSFLKGEKVKFGAKGYDWSGRGAREIAHEFEVAYWE